MASAPPDVSATLDRRPRRVISMRLVVTTVAVGLIAAAVLGVGAVSETNARRALTREIETRLLLEARNLALTSAVALMSELPELTLHPLVKEMQGERSELAFVVVVDHRGIVQGHADARQLGQSWQLPVGLSPVAAPTRLAPGELLLGNRELLVVEAPVLPPTGQRAGTAIVGMRRAYVELAVASARRQQTLFLLVLLGLGVAVTLVLMSLLLKPIETLRAGLERIGRGDLDTPLRLDDRTELGLLADAVNEMAGKLKVAQREIVEKERLAREVELARELQQRLLPAGESAAGDFVLRGTHRAAAEVGGDYYDILALPEGRIGLAIADVSGKGLGGCLVMSMLSALLRAFRASHRSPTELLVQLEERLTETLPRGSFITMFYGILDPAAGTLTWASAGHSPMLVHRARDGRIEWHATRGIPLGAIRGGALRGTLEDRTLTLQPGDLLVQFTDGYTEAFDPSGLEQFGAERLEKLVAGSAEAGCQAVIETLNCAVQSWTGDQAPLDDETLLVVGRKPAAGSCAGSEPAALAHGALPDSAGPYPLDLLEQARRTGFNLMLPADLAQLERLEGWLDRLDDLAALEPQTRVRLESALYEVCANIIEHGYRDDASQRFQVWWLPPAGPATPAGPPAARAARVGQGRFVIRDHGFPFSPGRWQPADFNDRNVWKRGGGLGLDIIHRTMREVRYHPGTSAGNVTILAFDPAAAGDERKELPHA